jgi:predicted transcriptional regulator
MAIFNLELTAEQNQRVLKLAEIHRQSPDGILREAVEQFLDRFEKKTQFHQDALAAWEDYQTTGLHATGEEVDLWLARLEAGEAAEAPSCHV